MIIGSISENKDLEKRISITPDIAKKYISNGFKVLIDCTELKSSSNIEEILMVGIIFLFIYLKGFSVAIDCSCAFSRTKI